MTDIERYGRTFSFDDGTSAEVQDARIRNWMNKNAPDELKQEKTPTISAGSAKVEPVTNETKASSKDSPALRFLSHVLFGPWAQVAGLTQSGNKALGDVNTYRTLAQGVTPFSDEAIAGIRSLTGTPYDTALAEERKGLKDFGEDYGTLAQGALGLTGSLATLPVGGAALKALPAGAKLAALAAQYPLASAVLGGAATGATAGFGAGEGGLGNRLSNAGESAALGAALGAAAHAGVKGAERLGRFMSKDERLSDFFRQKIAAQKDLDIKSPTFNRDADRVLTNEVADQMHLRTDPVVADLLPDATESVIGKPTRGAKQLDKSLYERQFNEELARTNPALAREQSQTGRIGKAFDTAFGPDIFKLEDKALIAQRKANAQQGFAPAYAQNVSSPEIRDALQRLDALNPNIQREAQRWAVADRRPIGTFDSDGNLLDYNTRYLHDIKRSVDQHLGDAIKGPMPNLKFNDVPYNNAKSDLNAAMMKINPEYEKAMKQYGEDSGLIDALKKGREEVFAPGSIDKNGGMDSAAIRSYMANANIPQAQKDLFLVGAARDLRQRMLANQSKKYSHNWSDFINNPELEDRIGALVNGRQLGGWDLFRSQLRQENRNYQNAAKAAGNSATARRLAQDKDMEDTGAGPLAAMALMIAPKAPGPWRGVGRTMLEHISPVRKMQDQAATILSRKGVDDPATLLGAMTQTIPSYKRFPFSTPVPGTPISTPSNKSGITQSLDEIKALLDKSQSRRDFYKKLSQIAPLYAGANVYSSPRKED